MTHLRIRLAAVSTVAGMVLGLSGWGAYREVGPVSDTRAHRLAREVAAERDPIRLVHRLNDLTPNEQRAVLRVLTDVRPAQ
jgi:hypothetical protein